MEEGDEERGGPPLGEVFARPGQRERAQSWEKAGVEEKGEEEGGKAFQKVGRGREGGREGRRKGDGRVASVQEPVAEYRPFIPQ
jgi:hypothetical protein